MDGGVPLVERIVKTRKVAQRKPRGARALDDEVDPAHLFEFKDRVTLSCTICRPGEHTIGLYIPERREGTLAELRQRGWLKETEET